MSTVASRKALEKWITVAQAAERLKISTRRVLELIAQDRLKAEQVNSRFYLVDADDVERESTVIRRPGRPRRDAN